MKKLVLIRLGEVHIDTKVVKALAPHMTGRAIAFPIPEGIVLVFDSPHSIEEVGESVKEAGIFFFLVEFDKMQMNLPEVIMQVVSQAIDEKLQVKEEDLTIDDTLDLITQKLQVKEEDLTIDDVLDLINQNGIESLTPAQRRVLDQGHE